MNVTCSAWSKVDGDPAMRTVPSMTQAVFGVWLLVCCGRYAIAEDRIMHERFASIKEASLLAVGVMLDGGSRYWEFKNGNGESFWVIPRTGFEATPPFKISVCLSKTPSGGFTDAFDLEVGSEAEAHLIDLLTRGAAAIPKGDPKNHLELQRIGYLADFVKDRSRIPGTFRLSTKGHPFEERY